MQDADLARHAARLHALLAELALDEDASEDNRQVVTLDQQAVGRLSRMDAMQQQAMAQAQSARRGVMGRRIAAALARIADGTFGECEICGDDIAPRRLDLDPTLPTCVDCARR